MAPSEFFETRQAAAALKHGILRRYLHTFCSKTGSTSQDHRVVFLDGYAGEGVYADGQPGSPVLAATTAGRLAHNRRLLGIYVEKDRDRAAKLQECLAETTHEHTVVVGTLEDALPAIMESTPTDAPLLAFLDPFGLPISADGVSAIADHARIVQGHRRGPPTEILLTVSLAGLRRSAGHLTSQCESPRYLKCRDTILKRTDAIMGGDWWRPVWTQGDRHRVLEIAAKYSQVLAKKTRAKSWFSVPVSQGPGKPVVYILLFLTHYAEEGIWCFNECVSNAIEEWRKRFGETSTPLIDFDAHFVRSIERSLSQHLRTNSHIHLGKEVLTAYGQVVGYAREKHLRQALKRLYKAGVTDHDGTGVLKHAVVRRAAH